MGCHWGKTIMEKNTVKVLRLKNPYYFKFQNYQLDKVESNLLSNVFFFPTFDFLTLKPSIKYISAISCLFFATFLQYEICPKTTL